MEDRRLRVQSMSHGADHTEGNERSHIDSTDVPLLLFIRDLGEKRPKLKLKVNLPKT